MDIITQSLLGGVLAQSVARKEEIKYATIIGMFSGLMADADIFISSSTDPLLNIEFHRHFTHSLFFIPFGAAIAMLIVWPFIKDRLPLRRIYLYSFLGYSMSGLLDACTSYGTHLLWPLSDDRSAFNLISIIDPIFSISLLTALLVSLRVKRKKIAQLGILFAAMYMFIGYVQLQRATTVAEILITSRGHQANQHIVKPTLGNLLLWRSVYIHQKKIYVDAIRVGIFDENNIFEGESVELLSIDKSYPQLEKSSVLYKDIKRFSEFSNGFIAIDPTQKNVIGDIRYSMLPVSAKPLWGVVININEPQMHIDYQFFREADSRSRESFINMLVKNKKL